MTTQKNKGGRPAITLTSEQATIETIGMAEGQHLPSRSSQEVNS